ncbi:MAG TPA: DUF4382 domain-containing protein [Gemmatimonadaceae bacterium]|nr:DUF4382 domain-containing protein [Gemmatimonadaceae bacterium]
MNLWTRSRLTRLAATTAIAASTLLPLAGCGDGPTTGGSGDARLSLLLTDAPGDFGAAVVTVSEIYLQGSEGRVTLMSTPVTTDLLTLANATAELVQDAAVPAGTYSELRFVVTGGYVEVEQEDGSAAIYASSADYEGLPAGAEVAGTLRMPSFAQSGLKVKLPDGGLTLASEQKVLLVDFDVAQSFGHAAGNSGAWVMSPVLTATEVQASAGLTVSVGTDAAVALPTIGGTVLALTDLKVALSNAEGAHEELPLTDADGDGTFEAQFRYVLPGAWTVDLVAPAGVTLTTTETRPAPVTLTAGAESTTSLTITGVTYQEPAPATP